MTDTKSNMEIKLFEEVENLENRKRMVSDNCTRIEQRPVKRHFNDKERDEMKTKIAELATKRQEIEEEIARITKPLKDELKEVKDELSETATNRRLGFVEVIEDVYLYDFQGEGMMGIYNSKGELMERRPLYPEERQSNVISMSRQANG